MPEPAASLDRVKLTASLTPAERAILARQCSWRRYAPDEQIIDRAAENRDVCLVVEGQVRIVNYSLSGREISFDEVETGGHFGELSAIDGLPRSATAIAVTQCLVAFVPPKPFLDVAITHPEIALMVMRRMASIIRGATARIMDLSTLGANNRVHAELLRLGNKDRKPGSNVAEITPVPVHGDIASRVSTTRETVARVLGDLTRSRIVEKRGNTLVIRDYERLATMVEDVRGD